MSQPIDSAETDGAIGQPSGSLADASALSLAGRSRDLIGPQLLGFSGIGGFALAWCVAAKLRIHDGAQLTILFLAATALPLIALSLCVLKTHRRASTGISFDASGSTSVHRLLIKSLGLIATLACLALAYRLLPEYKKDFYAPVLVMLSWVIFPLGCLTALYFFWIDRRMTKGEDSYWHVGMLVMGRRHVVDRGLIRQHALLWVVKGFFLPLMLAGAAEMLPRFVDGGLQFGSFAMLYATSITLVYALDVIYGALGYLLTIRVLDAHVRSVELAPLGWVSAIICYVPFSTFVWGGFLKYEGRVQWHEWLAGYPVLYISWGFAIIVLHLIYVWATVSFGCRFSNLTNRGVIAEGPYRFVRHPAYLAKNLAWWLMYIPFCAYSDWRANLWGCASLLLTNFIYVIRAKTEERHLLSDPAYAAYHGWIEEHGLASQVKSLFLSGNGSHAKKD